MDANTSSVLFITCLQTQSPPHIGRLVLVEQPIPLLNEFFLFFSSVHLMTAPPLPLILPLFLPFPPLQLLRCFFLSFICFRLSSYTTSCPSFFFLIISSLIQPLFLSGSLVPLLPFTFSQSKPWIRHPIYYSPFTSHALQCFLSVKRMQSALIYWCFLFSSTVLRSF